MAKGKQRTPEEVMQVLSNYAVTDNYSETSRQTGIPLTTVFDIVEKHRGTKDFEELRKQKREEFSQRANRIVFKALTLLEKRYDTALESAKELDMLMDTMNSSTEIDKTAVAKQISKLQINTLSEITTSMGTLFDKMRLANGETTENASQTLEIKMSEDIKELSK